MAQTHSVNAWKILAWLVILTVIEIGLTYTSLPRAALASSLVGTAIIKAALVAMYFMHLKFEGRLIWAMLVGTCVIGVGFLLLLFPDIVVGYWG